MSIRKIFEYPDPVLRKKAKKIKEFDHRLSTLVEDMADTMYDAPGVGLAAPQIGESLQLIVVDMGGGKKRDFMVLVNPEITEAEGKQVDEEGCLSVPDLTSSVHRHKKITLSYQDESGKLEKMIAEDRFAVVLQHEIDHLHGILFIDHLSPLKRNLYKKKMKKQLAQRKTP